jgi:hypothetical protein
MPPKFDKLHQPDIMGKFPKNDKRKGGVIERKK